MTFSSSKPTGRQGGARNVFLAWSRCCRPKGVMDSFAIKEGSGLSWGSTGGVTVCVIHLREPSNHIWKRGSSSSSSPQSNIDAIQIWFSCIHNTYTSKVSAHNVSYCIQQGKKVRVDTAVGYCCSVGTAKRLTPLFLLINRNARPCYKIYLCMSNQEKCAI